MLYASRSGGSSRSVYPRAPAAPAASPACAARADASARSASVGISPNSIRSRLGSPAETVTGICWPMAGTLSCGTLQVCPTSSTEVAPCTRIDSRNSKSTLRFSFWRPAFSVGAIRMTVPSVATPSLILGPNSPTGSIVTARSVRVSPRGSPEHQPARQHLGGGRGIVVQALEVEFCGKLRRSATAREHQGAAAREALEIPSDSREAVVRHGRHHDDVRRNGVSRHVDAARWGVGPEVDVAPATAPQNEPETDERKRVQLARRAGEHGPPAGPAVPPAR